MEYVFFIDEEIMDLQNVKM
ncbi:hypothetical protein [Sicyoidochytrium minutum DNA virus]|nr:hypothetical protein [Sicyoidochytrium minutum DNA virus]